MRNKNGRVCGTRKVWNEGAFAGVLVFQLHTTQMSRVGQNRRYAPCMTVYYMISLPNTPYVHRIPYTVPCVHDHFGNTLSNNDLNFRFQFVRGSGDLILSSRALREGPVGN